MGLLLSVVMQGSRKSAGLTASCGAPGFERQDHGDTDLQQALRPGSSSALPQVAAVMFGHMHHRLNRRTGSGLRNMAHLDPDTGARSLCRTHEQQ